MRSSDILSQKEIEREKKIETRKYVKKRQCLKRWLLRNFWTCCWRHRHISTMCTKQEILSRHVRLQLQDTRDKEGASELPGDRR